MNGANYSPDTLLTDMKPDTGPAAKRARLWRLPDIGAFWTWLPALVFLPAILAPPLNHDVAGVLHFSQRWLAGEQMYVDLIDVNPPLIFILNLIPAAIAAVTPLSGPLAFQLCVLLLGVWIWYLSRRVRDPRGEGAIECALLDVLPVLFLLTAGYDFGQREHLMAMMSLPYILAAVRRARGEIPRLQIATALTAAVGLALKPHFLALPVLVELAVLLGLGWRALRNPVPWVMAAFFVLYAVSIPILLPAYFNSVVPLVWEHYVDLGNQSLFWIIFTDRLGAVIWPAMLPIAWFAMRRPGVPRMLFLGAVAALMSAIAQHKGWSYHVLPIELFTIATVLTLAARFLDRYSIAPPHLTVAVLSLVFAERALAVGEAPWREMTYPSSIAGRLTDALREYAYGERVLLLTPDIYPVYPAINYAHARSTLRTMNLWLLQGTNSECLPDGRRYREVWEMSRAEFFMYRTVAEDAAAAPPSVILVSRVPGIPWCGQEFDFIEYFSRHPLFAELWTHYRQAATVEQYSIYVRED